MGSMHTGLEERWNGFDKLAKFYEARAEGGVALIVTGGISPTFNGRLSLISSQLSSFLQLAKHRKVVKLYTSTIQKYAYRYYMRDVMLIIRLRLHRRLLSHRFHLMRQRH